MHLTALTKPVAAEPDVASPAPEEFRSPEGATLTTNHPLMKAALLCLFEVYPRSLAFSDLFARVERRLAGRVSPSSDQEHNGQLALADLALQCFYSNLIELHVCPPRFALEIGERPVASPLARLQATADARRITNLRHHCVELDDFDRLVLRHLDGTKGLEELVRDLERVTAEGTLSVCDNAGRPIGPGDQLRQVLRESVGPSMRRLAGNALLVE